MNRQQANAGMYDSVKTLRQLLGENNPLITCMILAGVVNFAQDQLETDLPPHAIIHPAAWKAAALEITRAMAATGIVAGPKQTS